MRKPGSAVGLFLIYSLLIGRLVLSSDDSNEQIAA